MYVERAGTPTAAEILQGLEALIAGDGDAVSCLANASALLHLHVPDINWVGFYVLRGGELVLGPFQGKPACTRIAIGQGVCGTALAKDETIVVADVHAFPGHIACDPASRSEIVVPLRVAGRTVGVLDCDAPMPGRFRQAERDLFEQAAQALGDALAASGASI